MQIGRRKFTIASGATAAILSLGFWGLMVDKLNGGEFVSTVYASCLLVGGYCGFNVTKAIFQKEDDV